MAEPEHVSLEEALYHLEIRERLARAYAGAIRASHAARRVEIHLGSDILAHLDRLCTEAIGESAIPRNMIWGFPAVPSAAAPDHISIHIVHTIA